ncbi:hypothetical protein [Kitasatospora sp. NPDC059327]|uniref:hypothetical protein n=1 Tax=Kitasatospora sp. NPDC059327 TaxID=3346803 RepID=UPI0036BD62B1
MLRIAQLCQQHGWTRYLTFDIELSRARKLAAQKDDNRDLLFVTVSRRTFYRWMGEGDRHEPRPETVRVLMYMFDMLDEPPMALFEEVEPVALGSAASPFDASALLGTGAAPAPVDPALLALAAGQITEIVEHYEMLGPQQLTREALLLRSMLQLLLGGRQTLRQRERTMQLRGQVSALLGYMSVNCGQPRSAEGYLAEAMSVAVEIEDTALQMWVLGTQSFSLYYQQDYRKADEAARMAVELDPTSPLAIRPLVNGRARALARLGVKREAEYVIGAALALTGRADDLPEGVSSCISLGAYSPARTLANAITAHLSLGDTSKVFTLAKEIEPMVSSSESVWTRALVGLDLATAHLQGNRPDVEQAMALGTTAIEAGGMPPIRSVHQRGGELLRQAGAWRGEAGVREYAERLRSWEASPLAAPLVASATT